MKHILIVDSLFTNTYHALTTSEGDRHHQLKSLTRESIHYINGILFYKLIIYAGASIHPEGLSFVLSKLRDTKDDPSGIGN